MTQQNTTLEAQCEDTHLELEDLEQRMLAETEELQAELDASKT